MKYNELQVFVLFFCVLKESVFFLLELQQTPYH